MSKEKLKPRPKGAKRFELSNLGTRRSYLYGLRFGRLNVLKIAERRNEVVYWLCQCDCGEKIIASAPDLKKRRVRTCGKPMCIYLLMKGEHEQEQRWASLP